MSSSPSTSGSSERGGVSRSYRRIPLTIISVACSGERGGSGWSIGDRIEACLEPSGDMDACHVAALYDKLEQSVVPCLCKAP